MGRCLSALTIPGCIFDVCRYYDTKTGEWGYERCCVASAEHDCYGQSPQQETHMSPLTVATVRR